MDLSKTIEAKSDQLNAEDVLVPVTVTIKDVRQGDADQPVWIELAEYPGKHFKPSKTVRRVLVSAWGPEANAYTGRRMTLFNDQTVKWAGEAIGGIRISHLSHLDKPLTLSLSVTRGKRKSTTVQPLKEAPATPARDFLAEAERANGHADTLRGLWIDAKAAGEPKAHLDTIAAMVTPDEVPAS
jgi:hypothetical protein